MEYRIVSRHFFRRRARARERKITRWQKRGSYVELRRIGVRAHANVRVIPASRGPFRWLVVAE